MAEAKQKVYNFDEMGDEADRPTGIINGKKYTMYDGLNDMGPKRIAEFYRIRRRVEETQEGDDMEGMMIALLEATPLLFVDKIPDDVLDSLSLGKLTKIYESFNAASTEDDQEPQEATEPAAAQA